MVTGLWTEEVVKKAGVAVIWIDRGAERQKEGGGWSWSRKNAINGLKTHLAVLDAFDGPYRAYILFGRRIRIAAFQLGREEKPIKAIEKAACSYHKRAGGRKNNERDTTKNLDCAAMCLLRAGCALGRIFNI